MSKSNNLLASTRHFGSRAEISLARSLMKVAEAGEAVRAAREALAHANSLAALPESALDFGNDLESAAGILKGARERAIEILQRA